MDFYKYQACGNDYIYINCFENPILNPSELSQKISDRHFGIGGDGLILILPSNIADAKMRIFNADGSEGNMCGNGIRCVAKYLYDEKKINKKECTIETKSGIKYLKILESDPTKSLIEVNMGPPIFKPDKIPVSNFDKILTKIINYLIKIYELDLEITCISMGNPHCVIFVDDVSKIDVTKIGKTVQTSGYFPKGVNVEFVEIARTPEKAIKIRVYERGSGETLACGTGACAAVAACIVNNFFDKNNEITVNFPKSKLFIEYKDTNILMRGEAVKVFSGVY
ncbi:MAG: diaminopimelate epimerase [Candidatus Improbicoccus devescovinae]|nr:MAG: diaminopimelate epimerase [Candidatus Improbicoccus devescovinae]